MPESMDENRRRDIFVLDTNVLLYNPKAIFAFPGEEVVIPDQVLVELDRLKTARADKEVRFRGREFARILFDLSESGKLAQGVPFGDDSVLRIVTFDAHKAPDNLSSKNTDDRILGIVYQLRRENPNKRVTVVTNDLNMLVKAQMLDIPVARPGEEFAYGRFKRSFVWANSQKRALSVVLAILTVAASIVYAQKLMEDKSQPKTPPKLLAQLQQYDAQETSYKMILDRNPKDLQALIGLGDVNYDWGEIYQDPKYYQEAVEYYRKALEIDPGNANVRLAMGIEYDKLGLHDVALGEFNKVIQAHPNSEVARYHAGVVLMEKHDYAKALEQFSKYKELAPGGPAIADVNRYLEQIKASPQ